MNKIAVIVPFYKRKDITSLCFERLLSQSKKYKFDVIVAGDDDSIIPEGFKSIKVPNSPLGNKNNALLAECKGYDAATIIGSDNFISNSIWELFSKMKLEDMSFYGFDNLHIYDTHSRTMGTDLEYSKGGNTTGVARLWTKSAMEAMDYKLWSSKKNSALDTDSKQRMAIKGIKEITIPYGKHFILDVKQEDNITSPNIVKTSSTFCNIDLIRLRFGEIGKKILKLKGGANKQIERPRVEVGYEKMVVFIKDDIGIKAGQVKVLRNDVANHVIKKGIAKIKL